ncbi:MAG: lipoyl(octanoyl) transferase LipB [Actinomycetota bacterium]
MLPIRVVEAGVVPYGIAEEWQRELHRRRVAQEIPDVLLLLEHPHVYTLGRRFNREHLLLDDRALAAAGIEVHECDRGGSVTYHGPGQLVGYPIIDLRPRPAGEEEPGRPDPIRYLRTLEEALIRAVRSLGVIASRRPGPPALTGVWVGDAKLASIGVHIGRGVSRHGFALNVGTDLSYFEGIVACGIDGVRMTSLAKLRCEDVPIGQVRRAVVERLSELLHRRPVPATPDDLGLAALGVPVEDGARVIELRSVRSPRGASELAHPEQGAGGH